MAAARMTQARLIRKLAERCEANNKVAHGFLEELAKSFLQETRENGVFVLPQHRAAGEVQAQGTPGKKSRYRGNKQNPG